MLVPLSWLQEYLSTSISLQELSETLTLAGLEVDKIEPIPLSFSGVVVGKVLDVKPHPSADKLKIAQVSDGTTTASVICGDPSCRAGMQTAYAKIGAKLSNESAATLKIKKAKLRGVESFGMLCTEKELGLSNYHETIMNIPTHISLGTDLREIFGETIIEISLTPNLGHCMSLLGIARELSAMIGAKVIKPSFKLEENKKEKTSDAIDVKIEQPDLCSRYSSRLIRHVKIGPSPFWLKKRIEAAGMRSINNIVDVTNYVMLALGQPMHAFDYDKIDGKTLSIKLTEKEITFKTLDHEKRKVPKDTLMIYDQTGPLAIAGVMGGFDSEVQESTSDILLEAANFNASCVRRTSKTLHLRTESSIRFERKIDQKKITHALDYAAHLIHQVAGGTVAEGMIDILAKPYKNKKIRLRVERVNNLLGTTLSTSEIESFFERLEMSVETTDNKTLQVTTPSYRNDLDEEVDLIEEVARVYGYNNIKKSKPSVINSSIPHTPMYLMEQKMRTLLLQEGLQEFLTCDLISPKLSTLSLEKTFPKEETIHVLHPSSIDQSILRTSLLPGLMQAIKHNFDRQIEDISAFEIGRIHFKDDNHFHEQTAAAIVMTGKQHPHSFEGKNQDVDFFDIKGVLENILDSLGISSVTFSHANLKSFHPGKQATLTVESIPIGVLGEIHPKRLEILDIEKRIFFAQLDLRELFQLKAPFKQMQPLPKFPNSDRDWTFTLKKDIPIQTIMHHIRNFHSKLLKNFFLLDLYESEKIGKTYKNLTFRFIYRDDQKTIEQPQVEKEHNRLIKTLSQKLEL